MLVSPQHTAKVVKLEMKLLMLIWPALPTLVGYPLFKAIKISNQLA